MKVTCTITPLKFIIFLFAIYLIIKNKKYIKKL